jgi:flagellar biosynthesis repressor protein FlbT
MPLKLKLAVNERMIVNGAVISNGGARTTLVIRNYAHIMREKDILQEAQVDTPTKIVYFLVQAMLMQPQPPPTLKDSYRAAHTRLMRAYVKEENLALLKEVDSLVVAQDYFKALMKLQSLIAYEAGLLHMPPHEWRRNSQREKTPPEAKPPPAASADSPERVRAGMALAAE